MADFVGALTKLSEVLMPSGTMLPFAGKSVPDGWLLCNGAAVSRTTYADLFAAIGTTWGAGDGSTTFNLPNCDSRFMEGTTDASKVGTYLEAGLPNISGEISTNITTKSTSFWGDCGVSYINTSGALSIKTRRAYDISSDAAEDDAVGGIVLSAKNSESIYGNANTVQPNAVQTLIIIKV